MNETKEKHTLFEGYIPMITALLLVWVDVPAYADVLGYAIDMEKLNHAQKVQLVRRCLLVEGARTLNGNDSRAIKLAQERFPLFVIDRVETKVVKQNVITARGTSWKLSSYRADHADHYKGKMDGFDAAVLWTSYNGGPWKVFGESDDVFMINEARHGIIGELLKNPTIESVEVKETKRPIVHGDREFVFCH